MPFLKVYPKISSALFVGLRSLDLILNLAEIIQLINHPVQRLVDPGLREIFPLNVW